MIAGTETGINKLNIVLKAGADLDLSLAVKRERQQKRQFTPLGRLEQIIFEPDRAFNPTTTTADAVRVGRRLYWREDGPWLARTKPEEDLIFTAPLRLPLPDVPDPTDTDLNPYKVDRGGISHLGKDEQPIEPRMLKQRLERIASAKFANFLVFQPVAQIILLMAGREGMVFGSMGDHRMPISSLVGWDGRKMALLIDPQNGEAFFTGGRYDLLSSKG